MAYPNNTSILRAIANGEVDFGLPNHYYLFRFKSEDADFPVAQTSFDPGDIGNLLNVAGIGVLSSSDNTSAALRFVQFVTEAESQGYFARETFEYPVISGITSDVDAAVPTRPLVALDELRDLEQTLEMLRDAGLL